MDLEKQTNSLMEAKSRIELARYYELIINGTIFDDDSEMAQAVESEMKNFAVTRLEELLGIRSSQPVSVQSQFTDDEVVVLKQLVTTLKRRQDAPTVPQVTPIVEKPVKKPSVKPLTTKKPRLKPIDAEPEDNDEAPAPVAKAKTSKKKDPTSQVTSPDAIPMPLGREFEMALEAKVQRDIQSRRENIQMGGVDEKSDQLYNKLLGR